MKSRMWRSAIFGELVLVVSAIAGGVARAETPPTPYPSMAPIEQYLMADRNAEIALARSAAPEAISRDARVLVLGRHGYETAVEGRNGFACAVERAWMSPFDDPGFWNPKLRAPICLNPAAARSILPITLKTTELVLSGLTKAQVLEGIRAAVARGELPPLEPGAMSYMMSKEQYLGDEAGHFAPHLMFYVPRTDPGTWGAGLRGSPVMQLPQFKDAPEPITAFLVPVGKWSDGTPRP